MKLFLESRYLTIFFLIFIFPNLVMSLFVFLLKGEMSYDGLVQPAFNPQA